MGEQPALRGSWRPGAVGFLTDTTLCIGCKACEVALQTVEPASNG